MTKLLLRISTALLLLIPIIHSCNQAPVVRENLESFTSFPAKDDLTLTKFLTLDTSVSPSALLLRDTAILAVNTDKLMRDYLFYDYSLSSKKLVGKYVRWGARTNHTYGPMSYGLHEGKTLWVHDLSLHKILLAPLASKVGFDTLSGVTDHKSSKFSYSVRLMADGKLLRSGIFDSPDYLEINDVANDTLISSLATFNDYGKTYAPNTWKAAYEGFLFLQPSEGAAVVACRYTDQIDLFDLKTGKHRMISGPEGYAPSFDPTPGVDHAILRKDDTRFAFLDGTVTNKHIYLMYSGRSRKEKNYNKSNAVYVYDWNGRPVRQLQLDRYVSGIAVSADDQNFYAIDQAQRAILHTQLKP